MRCAWGSDRVVRARRDRTISNTKRIRRAVGQIAKRGGKTALLVFKKSGHVRTAYYHPGIQKFHYSVTIQIIFTSFWSLVNVRFLTTPFLYSNQTMAWCHRWNFVVWCFTMILFYSSEPKMERHPVHSWGKVWKGLKEVLFADTAIIWEKVLWSDET